LEKKAHPFFFLPPLPSSFIFNLFHLLALATAAIKAPLLIPKPKPVPYLKDSIKASRKRAEALREILVASEIAVISLARF
jgi:hypothetical protein